MHSRSIPTAAFQALVVPCYYGRMLRRSAVAGYERLKSFYERYESAFMPTMLVAGTVFDAVTFRALDIATTFMLQGAYLVIAGACVVYSHVYDGIEGPRNRFLGYLRVAVKPVIQFTFGALLSMSLVFYWFSGAASVSWPLLGIVAALMASHELFRNFFSKPTVQMTVYAFILFSFCSLLFPFLFNSLHPIVFMFGALVSLALMFASVAVLGRFTRIIHEERVHMLAASTTVFAAMIAFYFFNIIPPLPLFLRDAGIYHDIVREGGDYVFTGEEETWLQKLIPSQTVHAAPGERIYAFTAVFAPTDLSTTIYHRWQYYDETNAAWVTKDRLSFGMSGGRDAGYRGYSYKTGLQAGKWRVTVETARGQVVGRIPFTVAATEQEPRP